MKLLYHNMGNMSTQANISIIIMCNRAGPSPSLPGSVLYTCTSQPLISVRVICSQWSYMFIVTELEAASSSRLCHKQTTYKYTKIPCFMAV